MNRLTRIIESVNVGLKTSYDRVFLRNLELEIDQDNVMKKPYTNSDLVYICISTTAKAISQVPIVWTNSAGEVIEVAHPMAEVVSKPNEYLDLYSFIEAIVSYLMLDGDVFIIPFPNYKQVDFLYVTNKRFIKPIKDKASNNLIGWDYNPRGILAQSATSMKLEVEDVCHVYFWNPYDPIMGQSPLEAGRIPITTDYVASRYNSAFFDNSANPGGILSTEQKLSDPQFQRLQQSIEGKHQGYRKSQRLMLLDRGLKYSQTSLSHKDMEFHDLRRFNAERIMQSLGMKKSIISVTEDLNRATAEVQKKEWWQSTNLPIMMLITSALNFSIFSQHGVNFGFGIDSIEALHSGYSDKVKTGLILNKMGFTANEINTRLDLGFEEKTWRDQWWRGMNLIAEDGSNGGEPPEPIPVLPAPAEEEIILIGEEVRQIEHQKTWDSIMNKVAPIEKKLEKKIVRIFFDMRKKALRVLFDEEKAIKSADDFRTIEFLEEMNNLERAAGDMYQESIIVGLDTLAAEIGFVIDFSLTDPVALHYLQTKQLKVRGVGTTIKRQLNEALSEGMVEGEGINQLADRVREVFNTGKARAKTIARTEVVGSSNFGRYEGINRSGFRMKQWLTAGDSKVRRGALYDHASMNGQQIPVGEYWQTSGGSLRYPGDYMGAPGNIINCRCIEVVVPDSL